MIQESFVTKFIGFIIYKNLNIYITFMKENKCKRFSLYYSFRVLFLKMGKKGRKRELAEKLATNKIH